MQLWFTVVLDELGWLTSTFLSTLYRTCCLYDICSNTKTPPLGLPRYPSQVLEIAAIGTAALKSKGSSAATSSKVKFETPLATAALLMEHKRLTAAVAEGTALEGVSGFL